MFESTFLLDAACVILHQSTQDKSWKKNSKDITQAIFAICLLLITLAGHITFIQCHINIDVVIMLHSFWTISHRFNPLVVCVFSSPELCSRWAIVITFRPSVCPSINIFKRLLLWSRWANFAQISYGASLGWENETLLKWSRSFYQAGHHAHIW